MKKLLAAIFVLTFAMTSCEKSEKPVITESQFIGGWEAQKFEYIDEYGLLNPDDTTIRIVKEESFQSSFADPGEFIFGFTSDSLFEYHAYDWDEPFTIVYAWTYSDDTLYLESTNIDYNEQDIYVYGIHVETVSDTSLVLSYKSYYSYNVGRKIEYSEYKDRIYFKKINSEDSGCHAAGRLIKGNKASFFKGLEKRRNRKR